MMVSDYAILLMFAMTDGVTGLVGEVCAAVKSRVTATFGVDHITSM
jgi:hypothetical protein